MVTTTKLIIKRGGRKAHHGAHGGAWKVAFADFTLAMMALFMVLWIMGAVTEDERKEIVAQLNGTSVFNGSGFNPFDVETGRGSAIIGETLAIAPPTEGATVSDTSAENSDNNANQPKEDLDSVLSRSDAELAQLRQQIQSIINSYHAQNLLTLETLPQGLRILIQDDQDRMMFPRGSAVLTPFYQRLLTELGPVFNRIDNKIMISGHTDAAQYSGNAAYNNWNLSGDRALAARRALERGGLESTRVLQVNAMSSRMPLDKADPLSARNRRIEIMVLTEAAAETLFQFYGREGENVVKPIADRLR
ncbi:MULTISPECIES: putative lateral flagellar export/assembly protein LafU [Pantoea]|nr:MULTISPECIES: putative lateral flagellar export/assembly protein LafU [Pantoea]KTS35961.1 flagellar motor protein B [Pantoea dispersa]KTS61701.1 flagellar motor protein B [Pantoea dispersa]NIG14883.1 putative lateral flagellar export/assembly protein LafU [Pantoea sp. Cy-640]